MPRRWLRWCLVAALVVVLPTPARAQASADSSVASGGSRTYNADHPWFVEGSIGAITPGPDGTDFGSGQNYAIHFGAQSRDWADIAIGLGWVNARNTEDAIDSDITYGTLRGRAWMRAGRFLGYGAGGLALYRFSVKQQSVLNSVEDDKLRFGGLLGVGVQYVRTKFWVGLGAQVLGAIGESNLANGNLLTLTTYDLSMGAPIGR